MASYAPLIKLDPNFNAANFKDKAEDLEGEFLEIAPPISVPGVSFIKSDKKVYTDAGFLYDASTKNLGIATGTDLPVSRLTISPAAYEPKISLLVSGANHSGFGCSQSSATGTLRDQLNYNLINTEGEHVFCVLGKNGLDAVGSKQLAKIFYSNLYSRPQMYIGTTALQGRDYQLQLEQDSAGKPGISGFWPNSSDERIKENIEFADLDVCYEAIKNIPLKRFNFKDGIYTDEQIKGDKHGLGFIAQDVQQYFPKSIEVKNMHGLDDCLLLDIDQIYKAMYGTVQKLIQITESQKNEIDTLKQEMSELKKLVF
jgi:hypothetical protein